MIERFSDWQSRLTAYLSVVARQPLAYGVHDCALFAAGAVAAMTGEDIAAPYRGRYSTLRGGLRVLRRDGLDDHVALARARLPLRGVVNALPGDVAICTGTDGLALGIVQGQGVYVLQPSGGIGILPLTDAVEVLAV